MYIKTGTSTWKNTAQLYIKSGASVWQRIRQGYIKTGISTWKRFFYEANLPIKLTDPKIHTVNTSGTGTIYDGPNATSPQELNADLFGKDGTYSNYISISGRKFSYASSLDATVRTTLVDDDRFTSAGGVTTAMRKLVDEQYLFYELTVSNGGDDYINPVSSNPVKMIKQAPPFAKSGPTLTGTLEPYNYLTFDFTLNDYYYNSLERDNSVIRWYRTSTVNTSYGATLLQETTLSSAIYDTSTANQISALDVYYTTANDVGYYIYAVIIGRNSYTRHYGYTDYEVDWITSANKIAGPISISNFSLTDSYDESPLDNKGNLASKGSIYANATVSNVDNTTTYRTRYRIYNNNTGVYYNPYTAATGTASATWQAYTADSSGSGTISTVSISNGTATIKDYVFIDSTFTGGTYSGGLPVWRLDIEISAIKTGGSRVIYSSPYVSYSLSPSPVASISLSSTSISPNTSVTVSGSITTGLGNYISYPRQYYVDFGDGSNSGWLPVGGYSYGTGDPTYSLSHTYTTAGTYYPSVITRPRYTTNSSTVVVQSAPTITNVTWDGATGWNVYFSGGNGPYYQIYWGTTSTPPTGDYYDAAGTSSPVSETISVGAYTYYFYVRSSSQNLGNTTTAGNATAGTFGPWSSAYSYTVSNLTTPTITGVTSSGPGANVSVTVSGGGPTYQIYWSASNAGVGTTVTPDGTSGTSTISDSTGPGLAGTWYMYARSARTTSTYGSTYSTAPSVYISSWTSAYSFTVTATRTLSFDANGGTSAPSSQTGTDSGSGATITITSSTPSRSGYTFAGWNTNSSGTGTNYSSGGSITITSDTTLYAKWTVNNLTAPSITGVTAPTTAGGNLTVSFTGGSGPAYQIYWMGSGGDYSVISGYDGTGSTSSPITVTGPSTSGNWIVAVRSVATTTTTGFGPSSTVSSWSSPATSFSTSFVVAPGTPTSLTATTNRSDGVNLVFSGSSGATSYDIFWNIVGGAAPTSSSIPDFAGVSSPYLDTTIANSSSRSYWVRGKNSAGTSAWYGPVTGTRTSSSVAPTTVTVTGNNSLTIGGTFSWSADGTPAPTYQYVIGYNATTSAGPFTTKYTSSSGLTTTSHRPGYDGGWSGAGYYRCTVTATNSAGSKAGSTITYMS